MGIDTKIEWAHHTFNPWRGCTKVSAGCANCYAEKMSKRNPTALGIWGPKGQRVVAAESYWGQPKTWNKNAIGAGERRRVFCASLADWAEDWAGVMTSTKGGPIYSGTYVNWVTVEGRAAAKSYGADATPITMTDVRRRLGRVIDETPGLDWMLLTKRPERIRQCWGEMFGDEQRRDNVWLLTSVEDQENADLRIPHLLRCADLSPVLGLSCEPLLGPVDITRLVQPSGDVIDGFYGWHEFGTMKRVTGIDLVIVTGIDLVIVGGESGPKSKRRAMNPDWARSLRDQCVASMTGVSFFMKQMDKVIPIPDDLLIRQLPKEAGR